MFLTEPKLALEDFTTSWKLFPSSWWILSTAFSLPSMAISSLWKHNLQLVVVSCQQQGVLRDSSSPTALSASQKAA
eukprot:1970779-Amphidinium_carterae.1